MPESRYESLLDRYLSIATTKKGTAYEVLAAMVCKTLEERNAVIHDIKLRGDSGVKHQIDIKVEKDGRARTLLIECKDFDAAGGKADLGIVRDFESAVADIGPDEAWIVTCIGFTAPALKYAKAKRIKPVMMRLFEEQDKDGRIMRVVLNFHIQTPRDPKANLFVDEAQFAILERAKQTAGIGQGMTPQDDAFFVMPDGARRHFNEVLTAEMNAAMGTRTEGLARCVVKPDGRKLVIGGIEVPYQGIVIDFGILTETVTREIVANRIAELILQGVGNADTIIFDDQLRRRTIDPETGEIT